MRKRTKRLAVGMFVRIRDIIMRIISPTCNSSSSSSSSSNSREVFIAMRRAATNGIYRVREVYSNCYNLVANTITRKRLAAKQRRSVLQQIIRPLRASRKEASQLLCQCIRLPLPVIFVHNVISLWYLYFKNEKNW